jgi:amyloid beta A4 precursor protein-binding family B protein 1-interacting protein
MLFTISLFYTYIFFLQEFFKSDAMRLPNLDGILYLKEGRKTWKKHYFLLRASGIYYTAKGKAKV